MSDWGEWAQRAGLSLSPLHTCRQVASQRASPCGTATPLAPSWVTSSRSRRAKWEPTGGVKCSRRSALSNPRAHQFPTPSLRQLSGMAMPPMGALRSSGDDRKAHQGRPSFCLLLSRDQEYRSMVYTLVTTYLAPCLDRPIPDQGSPSPHACHLLRRLGSRGDPIRPGIWNPTPSWSSS